MEKKRGFGYYWDFMDVSVIVFVAYSVINIIFPFTRLVGQTLASILLIAVTLFVFGFVGFKVSKVKDANPVKTGAYAGVIIGLVSAVLAIIAFYFFPASIAEALQKAAQAGANQATVETVMKVGLFVGLVIDPAIYAAIGALLVWVSKFIFKKSK